MKKILVVYSTFSGTTSDVARVISEELAKSTDNEVKLLQVSEAQDLSGYDAFVVGGPMIMGWHRDIQLFLRKNQNSLAGKPVALFTTAMSLTQTGEQKVNGVPVFVDPGLAEFPKNPQRLTIKERYAAIPNYTAPMIKAAGKAKPVSVALLGGRLDIYRLKIWAALFVMLIIQAKPGEKRNYETIRAWAKDISTIL